MVLNKGRLYDPEALPTCLRRAQNPIPASLESRGKLSPKPQDITFVNLPHATDKRKPQRFF
jgi:hypothetical protein